jgi:hypothetical protein
VVAHQNQMPVFYDDDDDNDDDDHFLKQHDLVDPMLFQSMSKKGD